MLLLTVLRRSTKYIAATRRRQRDINTLRGLNSHMLKDMGLRWEESQIVSIFDDIPVENSGDSRDTGSIVEVRNVAEEKPIVKGTHADNEDKVKILVCRYCGEKLA